MSDESPDEPRSHDRYAWRRRWIEGAAIVAFWGTIACLDVAQNAFDPHGGRGGVLPGEALYTFLEYALWVIATPVIFWLAGRYSFERRDAPRGVLLHVVVAVSACVDLATHVIWNALGVGRPRPVSLGAVLGGFHFLPELLLYLVVLAAGFVRAYFLRYRERVEEAARLRAEAAELHAHSARLQAQLAEARCQALRGQINPHFLFNTSSCSRSSRTPSSTASAAARTGGGSSCAPGGRGSTCTSACATTAPALRRPPVTARRPRRRASACATRGSVWRASTGRPSALPWSRPRAAAW